MNTAAPDPPRYNMALLWRICLVAAMGGLLFGYDWVVIGGAKPFYEPFFGIYALLGAGYYFQSTGLHMLILVIAAIACYAMSLAPIVWVVISEIFPNRIRGAAMSVAVSALWIGCTALTFTFPLLHRALGAHGVFWLYGAIRGVGFVVVFTALPETKGKSLEAIERELID